MNKHINSFDTVADYNGYISSQNAFFPNVAHVSGETRVRILDEAPASQYKMHFFDNNENQIEDLDKYGFTPLNTYAIKLYDNDNKDYVSTSDWYPEISDGKEIEATENPKSNYYSFSSNYYEENTYVNVKAIMDRQTVDEVDLLFIGGF